MWTSTRCRITSAVVAALIGVACGSENPRESESRPASDAVPSAAVAVSRPANPSDEPDASSAGIERVILIVVDTLRRDHVSVYGRKARTPTIDALGRRGTVFRNAYASFNLTTPSTGALFTGFTPSLEGSDLANPLDLSGKSWCGLARFEGAECLPSDVSTLAESLREAGLATLGFVANPLLFEHGYDRGFDQWHEIGRKTEAKNYKQTIANSRSRMAKHLHRRLFAAVDRLETDRFFLYVHYLDVHDYSVGRQRFGKRPVLYRRSVARFDRDLRELMKFLGKKGFTDDRTLFVLTADHGEALGEPSYFQTGGHKGNPALETMLAIPLIVAPRGPEGSDADAERLVRTQDIRGLIERRVGLASGPHGPLAPDEQFIAEYTVQTYHRGQWKSVRQRSSGEIALFDLSADFGEARDVAAAHPEIALAHAARMDALGAELRAEPSAGNELSETEINRLRELGYIE